MNLKLAFVLMATFLAGLSLLTPASQPNPIEAARLNNLGCAYMNQQLFEKGLKEFQQAVQADPNLAIARLNEGVAYLNLQKVDEAKSALDEAIKRLQRELYQGIFDYYKSYLAALEAARSQDPDAAARADEYESRRSSVEARLLQYAAEFESWYGLDQPQWIGLPRSSGDGVYREY